MKNSELAITMLSISIMFGVPILVTFAIYCFHYGLPKWLGNLIIPAKLIPKEERITVEDVASQGEWLVVGEQSIKKKYNSGKEEYTIRISMNRNGNPLLEMNAGTIRTRNQYHRYKSIEKVVLSAYKMIVKHHNLISNDSSELLKRANSVSQSSNKEAGDE